MPLIPWLVGGAAVGGVGYGAYNATNTLVKWLLVLVMLYVIASMTGVLK